MSILPEQAALERSYDQMELHLAQVQEELGKLVQLYAQMGETQRKLEELGASLPAEDVRKAVAQVHGGTELLARCAHRLIELLRSDRALMEAEGTLPPRVPQ